MYIFIKINYVIFKSRIIDRGTWSKTFVMERDDEEYYIQIATQIFRDICQLPSPYDIFITDTEVLKTKGDGLYENTNN